MKKVWKNRLQVDKSKYISIKEINLYGMLLLKYF